MKLKLECTRDDFHSVSKAVDQTRETSDTVKVPRGALAKLLRDHGHMISTFRNELEGEL